MRAIGYAKRGLGCGDAQIAGQRDGAAAADGDALHLGDRRLADPLQPVEDAVEPLFVFDAVLAVAETLKLRDIRAGDKRFPAGAPQDQDAKLAVGIDALAGGDERFVHLPRHRVARLGPVEG